MNPDTYNKNAHDVIVDLLNRSLLKNFKPEQVRITPDDSPEVGGAIYLPSPYDQNHWRERVSISVRIDGMSGVLRCWYYRLFLGMQIRHVAVEGDPYHTSHEEILERIRLRYGVFLDPAQVDVEIFPDVQPDGSHRCVVRPHVNHLVWSGALEVRLVASYHIALELPKPELGRLELFELPKQPPGSLEYVLLHRYGEGLNISVDWFERCHQVDLSGAVITIVNASDLILKTARTTIAGYGKVVVKQTRSEIQKLRTDVTHWFVIEARWPDGRLIVSDAIWIMIK